MAKVDIKIISVYNYMDEKQSDIYTNKIEKVETYGEVNSLNFEVPYYYYDADNELVYGDDGDRQVNPKILHLVNENIIKFEDYTYIIKNTKLVRNKKLYYSVECLGFGVGLSYKNISYITTVPPETNPLKITSNILYMLIARNEDTRGYVSSYTSNSITLGNGLVSGTNVYQGKYVAIIDGVGQGYNYEISSSSGDTLNINGSLFENLEVNNSFCIIHDSKYTIDNVDIDFIQEDSGDLIYRSFEFENKSIMSCLNSIATRMEGYLTFSTSYDTFYGGYICKIGLKKSRDDYQNVEFRYGKNLNDITKEADTMDNMYTVLYPYGDKDITINDISDVQRTDNGVTYNEHTNGQSYIENYQYYLNLGYDLEYCRKHFFNDIAFTDTNYVLIEDLYYDFSDKLNELSVPKLTYKITGSNLSIFDEYSYMEFNVGDKTRVYDSELGVSILANVMKKTTDYSNIEKLKIEISNTVNRFSDYMQRKFSDVLDYTDKKTDESESVYLKSNYNMLNNSGCELNNNVNDEPPFWEIENTNLDYTPIVGTNVFNGTKTFSINDANGNLGIGSLYQKVNDLVPYTYYTITVEMMTGNCEADLIVTEYDSSDNIIKSHIKKYKTLVSNNQKLNVLFQSNSNIDYVIVKIKKYNSKDGLASYVYFDNFKMEVGKYSTPYIDIESKTEFYNEQFLGALSRVDEITVDDIADNAITAPKIKTNAITGTKILNGAISTEKIAALAITSNLIASRTIVAGNIATGTISATEMAINSITANEISVSSLSSMSSNLGSITAGSLNIGSGRFEVDSFGNMTANNATLEGDFITKYGFNTVANLYKDTEGGRLLIYDNNEALNAAIGVESGADDNVGGTIVLYNDGINNKRVALGIGSRDRGAIQVLNEYGNVGVQVLSGGTLGNAGVVAIYDGLQNEKIRFRADGDSFIDTGDGLAIGSRSTGIYSLYVKDLSYLEEIRSRKYSTYDSSFALHNGVTDTFTLANGDVVEVINGLITGIT